MKNTNHVSHVLEKFFKAFYKTEDLALKVGIKGLTHTELHIIDAIGEDTITMHELSERVGTTMGTVTVAITKLKEKGFITRNRSDDDRRKVHVSLDTKGIEALEYHESYHNMLLSSITENISEKELINFTKTFEKILENLNKKTSFFTPQPITEFEAPATISIVAIKGTPIVIEYFKSNGIENFSVIEIVENNQKIIFKTEKGKTITIDSLDGKNLVGVRV